MYRRATQGIRSRFDNIAVNCAIGETICYSFGRGECLRKLAGSVGTILSLSAVSLLCVARTRNRFFRGAARARKTRPFYQFSRRPSRGKKRKEGETRRAHRRAAVRSKFNKCLFFTSVRPFVSFTNKKKKNIMDRWP